MPWHMEIIEAIIAGMKVCKTPYAAVLHIHYLTTLFTLSQHYLSENKPRLWIRYAIYSSYQLPALQEDARQNQDVQSDLVIKIIAR